MAYVDGFKHDIFISYARKDDLPPPGEERGWVSWLFEHLKFRLSRRLDGIEIWRDVREVQGTQRFDQTIEEALRSSAIFLALTSTNYLNSDYCGQELDDFQHSASADRVGLAVGNQVRIVNVLLNNIEHREWPEAFEGRTGFPFHDAEEPDQFGEPLDPEHPLFEQQLRKLVEALYKLLKTLKGAASAPVVVPSERIAGAVFMAAADMSRVKRRVIGDLEEEGITIVSGIPPPYGATDHDDRVAEALKGVDLSVHLLDDMPGAPIDGLRGKTYLQRQVELALDHAPSQLIWMPRELDVAAVEDAAHRAFLHRLENEMTDQQAYHFIRSAQTDIVRPIQERLQQLRQPAGGVAEPSLCLLDTHMQDEGTAFDIARKLKDEGIRPLITQEADDPQAVMELFERRLRQAKNLIVFFGAVSRGWVQRRIEMAMKIAVTEGWLFELKLGVFLAPPKTRDDAAFSFGPVSPAVFENTTAILSWLGRNESL